MGGLVWQAAHRPRTGEAARPVPRSANLSPSRWRASRDAATSRSDFVDAWERYVPVSPPETSGTTGTSGQAKDAVPAGRDVQVPAAQIPEGSPGPTAGHKDPPCFGAPDDYRAHTSAHYRDGLGWGCRACEAASST